jgi:hypothetical protein
MLRPATTLVCRCRPPTNHEVAEREIDEKLRSENDPCYCHHYLGVSRFGDSDSHPRTGPATVASPHSIPRGPQTPNPRPSTRREQSRETTLTQTALFTASCGPPLLLGQDATEPFAIASNSISRSFRSPRRCPDSLRRRDAIENVRGLTPHASRVILFGQPDDRRRSGRV